MYNIPYNSTEKKKSETKLFPLKESRKTEGGDVMFKRQFERSGITYVSWERGNNMIFIEGIRIFHWESCFIVHTL